MGLRCLVADDDQLGRELIAEYLNGFADCTMVDNGREAVEKFEGSLAEGSPFDFLILDVMMPELDGNQAGKAIRKLERARGLKQVKIIVLTAQNTPQDAMESFMSVQPAAHLIKPVDPNQLITTLKRVGIKPS